MSTSPSTPEPAATQQAVARTRAAGESLTVPFFTLLIGAAFWLVISSLFGLISSIKFHGPGFLADIDWLTYGRTRAAYTNLMLYGFCVPGGLAATLWILARDGACRVGMPLLATFGAAVLHLGVAVGLFGILHGDLTGYERFEMPGYAAIFIFSGYVLTGISAALTLHTRVSARMSVSQWFLLAALFWFPWIYATAGLMLLVQPPRGVTQSVVAWWFNANFEFVWLGLVGLAGVFHLLARGLQREFGGRNYALFTFWMLVLFGSWTGVPQTAPVPAWLPSLSTAATLLTSLLFIAVLLSFRDLARGRCREMWRGFSGFAAFGLSAFLLVGLISILPVVFGKREWLTFTWLGAARWHLLVFGFFGLTLFGCIYAELAEYLGETSRPVLMRPVFWTGAIGALLVALPFAGAGLLQAVKLANPQNAFVDVSRATLHFLRLGTIGDLLLLIGSLMLLVSIIRTALKIGVREGRKVYESARAEVSR